MSSDDEMTIEEQRKYLRAMNQWYDRANKDRRG